MIMITLAVLLLSFRASPALAESPPVGGPAMKSAIAGYAAARLAWRAHVVLAWRRRKAKRAGRNSRN